MNPMTELTRQVLEGRPIGMTLQLVRMCETITGYQLDPAWVEQIAARCTLTLADLLQHGEGTMQLDLTPEAALTLAAAERPDGLIVRITPATPSAPLITTWLTTYPAWVSIRREDRVLAPA